MTTLSKQSINSPQRSNKPVDEQLNIQRRRVVQGAALSAAAMTVPGLANAFCTHDAQTAALPENTINVDRALSGDDVAIKLVETEVSVKNGKLAQVTIKNNSQRSIKLNHVSPGAISTQKGVYQLNATLSNNPLSLRPGGAYQFWLTPDNGTQALLSSKPKPVAGEVNLPTTLEVSVITHLESGRWVGTQRLQAMIS